MTAQALVTDTHPLIWYFCTNQRKLSKRAQRAFDDAVQRKSRLIYVPAAVLWEVSMLVEAGAIKLDRSFAEFVEELFRLGCLIEAPFGRKTVIEYHGLTFTQDPFDRAIVASALELEIPLITNDGRIHDDAPCELFWD